MRCTTDVAMAVIPHTEVRLGATAHTRETARGGRYLVAIVLSEGGEEYNRK